MPYMKFEDSRTRKLAEHLVDDVFTPVNRVAREAMVEMFQRSLESFEAGENATELAKIEKAVRSVSAAPYRGDLIEGLGKAVDKVLAPPVPASLPKVEPPPVAETPSSDILTKDDYPF